MNKVKKSKKPLPEEQTYLVEKILGKKEESGVTKYKVLWKGYSIQDCTWEPIESFAGCEEIIDEFEKGLLIGTQDNIRVDEEKNDCESSVTSRTKMIGRKTKRDSSEVHLLESINKNDKENNDVKEDPKIQETTSNPQKYMKNYRTRRFRQEDNEDLQKRVVQSISEIGKGPKSSSKKAIHTKDPKDITKVSLTSQSDDNGKCLLNKSMSLNGKERIGKDIAEIEKLPLEGILEVDKPKKIINAKQHNDKDDEILCLVEWQARADQSLPMSSYYTNKELKDKYPMLLVEYYESRLTFPQGKERRKPQEKAQH